MIRCQYSELVDIHKLVPNPKNPNKHHEDQIERLAKIIDYQGMRSPIVVSKRSGFITKGHGRLEALKKIGWDKVPVDYQDYDNEAQEYADMVADNAIAEWAAQDLSMINAEMLELGPDFDVDLMGIKDFAIEPIEKYDEEKEDDVPEMPVIPVTTKGDVWLLGNHRVMCGDSTMIDDVEKLMNGEKADLWVTDPPYGVSYQSNGAEDKHRKIANDSMPLDEMKDFWQSVASNAITVCSDESPYYWFACQGGDQMMMMMMSLGDAGWRVRHELIWVKDSMVKGRCDYHYKHEPIFYGWKKKGKHNWYSDRKQTSVLEFSRPKKSDLHPTMKPVELIEYLISNSSNRGQCVLETHCGSGSTLIACEKTGRKCYGMELDEKYCDVIIKRWQDFTGKEAILESNGKKYNELAAIK